MATTKATVKKAKDKAAKAWFNAKTERQFKNAYRLRAMAYNTESVYLAQQADAKNRKK